MTQPHAIVERVVCSEAAKKTIDTLRAQHGELMFHQSGGCCDGSAPMCFAKGDFLVGSRDLWLGTIHGCPFFMAPDQFAYLASMQVTIDVHPGRGASFSLEIPLGVRFMTVSRLFTEAELPHVRSPIAFAQWGDDNAYFN